MRDTLFVREKNKTQHILKEEQYIFHHIQIATYFLQDRCTCFMICHETVLDGSTVG